MSRSSYVRVRFIVSLLVFTLIGTVSGCAGGSRPSGDAEPHGDRFGDEAAPSTVAERCFTDAPGMITSLAFESGRSRLGAVEYGSGSTTAIFLHQTGAGGLCGWVPHSSWAATQGIHAVLVDDCVHGTSVCSEDVIGDPRNAVAAAVAWARTRGAERVVVVGASMGGAVALGTAQEAGADAVVDLSGPSQWSGVPDAATAATGTRIPLLLVVARNDRQMGVRALRDAFAASPAVRKQFGLPKDGHGWDLAMSGDAPDLTPTLIGRQVLDWVRGNYPAPDADADADADAAAS